MASQPISMFFPMLAELYQSVSDTLGAHFLRNCGGPPETFSVMKQVNIMFLAMLAGVLAQLVKA